MATLCVQSDRSTDRGSYDVSRISADTTREIQRLNAQVELFWPEEVRLYERAGLKDGMRLVDCGCGPGYLMGKLCSAFPALQCTGVELAPELVAAAANTIPTPHRDRCRVLEQSVTVMELADNSFDFAISRLVIEHLPDPVSALKEVLRVLRPGERQCSLTTTLRCTSEPGPTAPPWTNSTTLPGGAPF